MVASVDPPRGIARNRVGIRTRIMRLLARPGLQSWAARFPLTQGRVRRDGAALFEIVQGFVASQVLMALVELRVLHRLMDGAADVDALGAATEVPPERMGQLLQAAAALGLAKRRRDGRFRITARGAALIGVPGLEAMIDHHRILYRDLADPVALLRGSAETELAGFWPYVFGAEGARDTAVVDRYSDLMADSQALVAEDTLAAVPLTQIRHLMDVGGGTGTFAIAAARAAPALKVTLVDLPAVTAAAAARLAREGLGHRIVPVAASFRDEALPEGADAVSLVRVLYDHDDRTVRALLARVHAALPPGGLVLISEPMSGGATPDRAGDIYYAFYTMAMRTGTVRSPERIARLLLEAGFEQVRAPKPRRSFVTRTVTARRR
ncbi:methyltransferase [Roseivivax isoporae]|uniref:SAM-dependent methlyltransferase n=1 Tax=Roseivivax isoporae LMG 25204 TaxID=1449351 RepID=X7FBY9_9RHOB|nr:methyltransferase [Roseivivax isoporae]ETX29606.1 SAM-dependent methlyltransferase [Roseivivax isoporae LMG 25204]